MKHFSSAEMLFFSHIYESVVEANAKALNENNKPMSLATNIMLHSLEDSKRETDYHRSCRLGGDS